MLGLILYIISEKSFNYREYAQCKLREPLKKDSIYRLSFKVKLSLNSNSAINNIGIYLSSTFLPHTSTSDPLKLKPQLNSSEIVSKDKQWKELIYEFKASENYQYLTVGNFYSNAETKFEVLQSDLKVQPRAYYFFDDFKLSFKNQVRTTVEKETDFKTVFNPNNIFFESNQSELNDKSKFEIDKIANFLKVHERLKLVIHGYTDDKGGEVFNLKLSEQRACNIKTYLLKIGLLENRVQCIGHGKQKNNEPNAFERKVVFKLN